MANFPMLDGPAIPWADGKRIYETLYCPLFGDLQSLERIAARGGFGYHEVELMRRMARERGIDPGNPTA